VGQTWRQSVQGLIAADTTAIVGITHIIIAVATNENYLSTGKNAVANSGKSSSKMKSRPPALEHRADKTRIAVSIEGAAGDLCFG
jgi:hypothetical protein